MIESGLIGLMHETEKISELEIKIEKPYEIEDIVEKILDFNQQYQQRTMGKYINTKSNAS